MPPSLEPMVPVPASGRLFVGRRQVRLGDVTPQGRLRLDALTRYAQDVSNDDTTDAGLVDDLAWVVRTTTIDVIRPPRFAESMELTTFCGGMGRRWAERRLRVIGDAGGRIEVATLWVHVDAGTGRPKELPAQFRELYGEAARCRVVGARQHLGPPPTGAPARPWAVRAADLDLFGHVNNAAYWAAVEEVLADRPVPEPYRAVAEYGPGLERSPGVELLVTEGADGGFDAWLVRERVAFASFAVRPLPWTGGGVSAR